MIVQRFSRDFIFERSPYPHSAPYSNHTLAHIATELEDPVLPLSLPWRQIKSYRLGSRDVGQVHWVTTWIEYVRLAGIAGHFKSYSESFLKERFHSFMMTDITITGPRVIEDWNFGHWKSHRGFERLFIVLRIWDCVPLAGHWTIDALYISTPTM